MPKKKKTPNPAADLPETPAAPERVEETPWEALASICSVLVIGLYILTFLGQNFVIPSGSMEKTLLIGDHLVVDRITLAPPTKWFPLVHYREPRRGDIVVFIKPVPDDVDGTPTYQFLVKRLVGVPGDRIRLHNGVVYINGQPHDYDQSEKPTPETHQAFLDEFPTLPPPPSAQVPESWSEVEFPRQVENGELVVPPGKFFMMGDHRHNSLDSRYWGFVPRENIVGRPLFNYWSFETPDDQYDKPGLGAKLGWFGHIALHFFTETRWSRTLHVVR